MVDFLENLLTWEKYQDALMLADDEKYGPAFIANCTDIMTKTIEKIENNTAITKPSLQSTCEQLLEICIAKGTPEECLLEFIEQIEVAKNDAQFTLILHPLQLLLLKLKTKREMSLEWCLNSISTYIELIPAPDFALEGKERLLMDSDPNVRRIVKAYRQITIFCAPFIKEVISLESNFKAKQIITAFLISLFGKPLIYLDLDPEHNAKSEIRQVCTQMISYICQMEHDVTKFFPYLETCARENTRKNKSAPARSSETEDYESHPYEQKYKLNITTLSGMFYVVFSNHFEVPDYAVPQIYSIDYIVHTVLLSALHLLEFSQFGPLSKALVLTKALLQHFPENISHDLLAHQIHFDLLKCLVNVAVFSTYESLRKQAVNLINLHYHKFDFTGRTKMVHYLIETSNHSGVIGYSITLFKNSINEAFTKPDEFPACFKGYQLSAMLKKMCKLPHGPESDLVEIADQVITALNFIRYLAIRDVNNLTGIRDCFPYVESEFLEPLRVGLNMSKAHYEVKKKDLEDNKKTSSTVHVSINVGGNIMDDIPIEQKQEVINSALNAFHLMEGLVARLSECINLNKMQGLSMDCKQ